MHNSFRARHTHPARIQESWNVVSQFLNIFNAVQRVSSVQLVAWVFQNDQRRKGTIVASLVLSTGNTKNAGLRKQS